MVPRPADCLILRCHSVASVASARNPDSAAFQIGAFRVVRALNRPRSRFQALALLARNDGNANHLYGSNMRSRIGALAALLMALAAGSLAQAQAQASQSRDKTMSDDPTTNTVLSNFSERLPGIDEQRARTIRLALILAASCRGVALDEARLRVEVSRFEARPVDVRIRAITLTNPSFDYLDADAIAHLCAGVDYLFGRTGRMVRGLMSPGSGELIQLRHTHKFHIAIPRELLGAQ